MGIRAIDRARAAQMVQAQLLGDAEMFAVAVQQAFDDDFGIGGMGSTINVLRSLSESLAEGLVAIHGEAAPSLVAEVLMQEAAGD